MGSVFRNSAPADVAIDELLTATILLNRMSRIEGEDSYTNRMNRWDLKRTIYVAWRNLANQNIALQATTIDREVFVHSDGKYARPRTTTTPVEAVEVAGAIRFWDMPDVPPISDNMIVGVRANIEMLTNCISKGIIGDEEKLLYAELREDFADFGKTGTLIGTAIPGDQYDPRVRVTFESKGARQVSWFIWLSFDERVSGAYKQYSTDCVALIKGLCNASKTSFSFK